MGRRLLTATNQEPKTTAANQERNKSGPQTDPNRQPGAHQKRAAASWDLRWGLLGPRDLLGPPAGASWYPPLFGHPVRYGGVITPAGVHADDEEI